MKPEPELKWLRYPSASAYSGFSIRTLERMVQNGQVTSKLVKRTGKGRGLRLILRESLDTYIDTYSAT